MSNSEKLKKAAGKSWQTTVAGIAQFVGVLAVAVAAQFDSDPATIASWSSVVASGAVMFGLAAARDNGVSSEQAGAAKGEGDA